MNDQAARISILAGSSLRGRIRSRRPLGAKQVNTACRRGGPYVLHIWQSQPELATSFFAAGPRRAWDILERIIIAGQARGQLGEIDPALAVNDLIGLWQGSWWTEIMYGQRPLPDEQELRQRSRHAIDVFLRAYGKGV